MPMAPRIEIAAIAGSLRAGSWARALLRAAADRVPPCVGLTIWEGLEEVPPFNEDRETRPAHPAVAEMRALVEGSGALLIVTPEYNGSLPGVLKNALDWASRPYGASALQSRPVAALGTSPLPSGGASALSDLKRLLMRIRADVVDAELAVGKVHTKVVDGKIADPELADQIDQLLAAIAEHAAARVSVLVDA